MRVLSSPPAFSVAPMLRLQCPTCRRLFMLLASVEEASAVCPYCGTVFRPREEELVDPEDD